MHSNEKTTALNLLPVHLADLRASGLTDKTIREAGLYSESDHIKLAVITGRAYPKARGDALVFPFRDSDGNLNGFKRIKPCFPAKDRNGRAVKYLSPKGSTNRAYFPAGVQSLFDNPAAELMIVEGEKKSLAATQEGFPAIGLIGVYGWKEGKQADRLIPDLELVDWNGRQVFIGYDSDLIDKPEVREAESRLTAQLKARGARVKCVRIPDGPERKKQGVDDFLVAHGKVAFRKLLDAAVEPDDAQDTGKVAGRQLDPMDEARRFIERRCMDHGRRTLQTHRGACWGWNEKQYREIPDDELRSLLYVYLDQFAFQLSGAVVSNLASALRAITHIRSDRETPLWLDGSREGKDFVSMANGILDVQALLRGETDVLLPHTPAWFSTTCLPYAFDPAGKCPRWLSTLEKNMEGDEDRLAILQEWAGLCVVHDTSFQKFMVATGDGSNGKSVYCAGVTGILGGDNVSHLPLEAFGQRFRLWETYGKLANIAAEVGEIDRVAEGVLKSFTSGDRQGFERKYEDTVNAIPTARLMLATNTLPRFNDRSSGIWRRMILVPFNVTIRDEEKIRDLDKPWHWEQAGELPGMFNWALVGLDRLRRRGRFTRSELCEAELAKYRRECNPAALFLAEACVADPHGDVVTAEIYTRYSQWCVSNGFRPLASNTFGTELRRAFPSAVQGKVYARSGQRTEGYKGVRLLDEIGNNPDNPDNG